MDEVLSNNFSVHMFATMVCMKLCDANTALDFR